MKTENAVITEDEAALYDRQIRLWGVDAQRRLLASRVCLVNMSGLGAEITKNLVLSGIHSLCVLDSSTCTDQDLKSNFLLPRDSAGKNRGESSLAALQTLNPMVKIVADTGKLSDKDTAFFSSENFDVVCMLSDDLDEMQRVNKLTRENKLLFIGGLVFGFHGYMFVDFDKFEYIVEAPKISEDSAEKKNAVKGTACSTKKPESEQEQEDKAAFEQKTIQYKGFEEYLKDYCGPLKAVAKSSNKLKRLSKTYVLLFLLNEFNLKFKKSIHNESKQELIEFKQELFKSLDLDQDILDDSLILKQAFGELSPVNAVLGGVIAQETIKAISRKNEPTNNLFVFDGSLMNGEVFKI